MIPVSRIDSLIHELGRYSVPFQLWAFWDFEERLDPYLLKKAVSLLFLRAPVLGCRLKKRFYRDQFVPIENLNPEDLVSFEEVEDQRAIQKRTNDVIDTVLDIENGPAVAIYCFFCDSTTRLIFQVHHVFVDGRSTVNLMTELANLYTKLSMDPDFKQREELDRDRGLWQIVRNLTFKHWLIMGFTLLVEQVFKSFISKKEFEPLATDENPKITVNLGVARYGTIEIDPATVSRIRNWCSNFDAKINDFLMTTLLVAINSWNRKKSAPKRKYVPLVFAADMRRRYAPKVGPVANLSSAQRFWIKRNSIKDFQSTAKVVKAKMDGMKRRGLSLDGIAVILKGALIPGAIARVLFKPVFKQMVRYISRVTGLTNIGPIPDEAGRFGELEAHRCSILVPIFPVKNLLFAATTYKDRITLQMGYDGVGLSRSEAAEFGKLVSETIEEALD